MKIKGTPWWDYHYKELSQTDKRMLKAFHKAQDETIKRVEANPEASIKKFLDKKYPGCKNLSEAVEVAKFNLRVERELNKPDGGGAA
jgi:hypothetical protein